VAQIITAARRDLQYCTHKSQITNPKLGNSDLVYSVYRSL